MAKALETKLKKSIQENTYKSEVQKSRDWLRAQAIKKRKENSARRRKTKQNLMGDEERIANRIQVGQMFSFNYDAKHQDTLKYWDYHPVIFPIEIYSDGFLGLNLHYLQPLLRARLMDAILDQPSYKTDKQRAKLSYDIIMGFAASDLAKPTIHRYLSGYISGHVIEVMRAEWDYVAFLPLQDFRSNTQIVNNSMVYSDSRKIKSRTIKR